MMICMVRVSVEMDARKQKKMSEGGRKREG
jgi:hypothetical protein